MAQTSSGIITDGTTIDVNELNWTQSITPHASPRNVTINASNNTHTKSPNENRYNDKSVTVAKTQQNFPLHVENSPSVITDDSLNSTPNIVQMVNKTIILTFLLLNIIFYHHFPSHI